MYGFNSAVFVVQQATFVTSFLGLGFLYMMFKVTGIVMGGEKRIKIEKKVLSLLLAILMRIMISFSSPICTSLVISIMFMSLESAFKVFSFVTSIVILLVIVAIQVYIIWSLIKNKERLLDDDFEPRYGSFYRRMRH